jgi:agmatine deiminase
MTDAMIPLVKEIAGEVRVRILYNQWVSWQEQASVKAPPRSLSAMRARIGARLEAAGVALSRIDFAEAPYLFGAIQDPGPVFLRAEGGKRAIADFSSGHPVAVVARLDRLLTQPLGISVLSSEMRSDGGNRQCNGRGIMLVGGAFDDESNPGMTRAAMEAEYCRVQGVEKVVWLEHGPREEDVGRLEDGRWGIGTGGHVDEFCRFVDANTVILAEVPPAERELTPIHAETHRRMQENFAILEAARDIDGRRFRILRAPTAHLMTHKMNYDLLTPIERFWFEGAAEDEEIEFYLPGSYLNFVMANGVVVTSKYWRSGMDDRIRIRDAEGLAAVQAAFPDRRVVQIDAMPLLHDGGGIHCYTRNQPFAIARSVYG